MGIGTSIFLIAVGAILYFAVNVDISGLELSTIGADPDDRRHPRPDHLALPDDRPRRGAPSRRRTGRSCASATSTRPRPAARGRSVLGLIRPRWRARRSGTWRHSVKWCARITNATRASWPAAAQVWPLRCGEPERADDVAPVVLDLEQPRAARQLVVEPADLLARLQLDRHRLRDERRDGEVARRAVGVAAAQRRGPARQHGAQALGLALASGRGWLLGSGWRATGPASRSAAARTTSAAASSGVVRARRDAAAA